MSNYIYCFITFFFHLTIRYGLFFQVKTWKSNYFYWLCGFSIVRIYHHHLFDESPTDGTLKETISIEECHIFMSLSNGFTAINSWKWVEYAHFRFFSFKKNAYFCHIGHRGWTPEWGWPSKFITASGHGLDSDSSRGLGQCWIFLDKSLCELPTASTADNDEQARLGQAALCSYPACWLASALSNF